VNATNVTCGGCYHFRRSESLHNQNKSWFFVNNRDSCDKRDSGIIPLGLGRTGMQITEIRELQDNLKTPPITERRQQTCVKDITVY